MSKNKGNVLENENTNAENWKCDREFTVKLKVNHKSYDKDFIKRYLENTFEYLFITVEEVLQNK